jgi:hypothetical protein
LRKSIYSGKIEDEQKAMFKIEINSNSFDGMTTEAVRQQTSKMKSEKKTIYPKSVLLRT